MSNTSNIQVNDNGGIYSNGEAFSTSKWVEIITTYNAVVDRDGKCTCKLLASECKISISSASKAITAAKNGTIPTTAKQGHGKTGVGSMKNLKLEHHSYIYSLYLRNLLDQESAMFIR